VKAKVAETGLKLYLTPTPAINGKRGKSNFENGI
jgi:hypothetical protein